MQRLWLLEAQPWLKGGAAGAGRGEPRFAVAEHHLRCFYDGSHVQIAKKHHHQSMAGGGHKIPKMYFFCSTLTIMQSNTHLFS